MSFKDDFFEALRSVKRDFVKDPESIASSGEATSTKAQGNMPPDLPVRPPEPVAAKSPESAVVPKALEDTGDFRMPDNIVTPDDAASNASSDYEVMEAFEQASVINDTNDYSEDDTVGQVHTLGGNESPLYRDYVPSEGAAVYPSSSDSRKIFDFDASDLYSDDKTVISRNTLIKGNLMTEDSLRLLGSIMGDIDCKSNIVVAGKVRGNTSAANAYIVDAQIDGDMVLDDTVNVNKDAWILGNIRAQQAEIDGKIKGNIEIRHTVSIGTTSSIIGNISTDELEIKRGAFVNGQIIMYTPSKDVLDRFEDFGDS